nr:hypothetical protein [Tanacetum cinerariifolium]
DKYVGDILKKFGYSDVRSSNTPMDKENPWGKDGTRKDVDLHLYRSMIGSLMYLTASRPDFMFAVCACARHQVTPKECHLHAVKSIFRYLKGHPKLGIWYPKASPLDLVAFSDSDYGGASQDRKSTTGGTASCCGQVLWIHKELFDYGHHFIRDCFEKKLISVDHIHTDENVADLLTKPFDAGRFEYLVCKLFPLLGKLSTVSVFLGFGLTCAGTSKYWGILRMLMIGLRLIPRVSKDDTTMMASLIRMARLQFCDYHNMVAILEKGEYNIDFHPMVDFIATSPLKRNLKLRDEEGIVSIPDMELFENLTLMGPKSIGFNEFSSNIATALVCLATNRTYNFSKMIFDGMVKNLNNKISKFLMYPRIVPHFDTMLVHQGEGSGTPTEPHHTPSLEADTSHHTTSSIPLPSIPTAPIP